MPAGRAAEAPSPEGFSLHADTWLHENDVVGLERLSDDGACRPLSLERRSALPDGRLAYRMKRPYPTGQTHLVLPPVAILRRLAALVPPPRANLLRYFGVFAPNPRAWGTSESARNPSTRTGAPPFIEASYGWSTLTTIWTALCP